MLAEYTLLKMILASATLLWRRRPRRVCRPQVLDEGTIYFQKNRFLEQQRLPAPWSSSCVACPCEWDRRKTAARAPGRPS